MRRATIAGIPIYNETINTTVSKSLQSIKVKEEEGSKTIVLVEVKKGKDTPYYYKGKAFKRADTSTVEVDRFELRRLAMEGINIDDEERKAVSQDLSFNVLEYRLSKDEFFIYNLLKEGLELTGKEIDLKTEFEKSKTLRILNSLVYKNIVAKIGSGTAVKYKLK